MNLLICGQHLTKTQTKNDSDFDEDIVVTRQEEERDPEAEAAFYRELSKMMSESLDSRKFDRRPVFDVPLPMRKVPREVLNSAADDSGNEGTATPPRTDTMAFSLMTKKGNRQQASSEPRCAVVSADNMIDTNYRNAFQFSVCCHHEESEGGGAR